MLQSGLEGVSGDEMTMSPGPQFQQQLPLQQQQGVAGVAGTVGTSGPGRTTAAPAAPLDQSKISVFQGALSSPNRRCLPAFGPTPSGYGVINNHGQPGRRPGLFLEQPTEVVREDQQESTPYHHDAVNATGFGFHLPPQQHHQQHHQQSRDAHLLSENDSSMDMHADGVSDNYFR